MAPEPSNPTLCVLVSTESSPSNMPASGKRLSGFLLQTAEDDVLERLGHPPRPWRGPSGAMYASVPTMTPDCVGAPRSLCTRARPKSRILTHWFLPSSQMLAG